MHLMSCSDLPSVKRCLIAHVDRTSASPSAGNLRTPLCPRLGRKLADVALSLLLELHLVPVVVERHNCVDRIAELWHEQQRVDRADQVLDRCINCPVAIEDGVTDAAVAVDVGMVHGCNEAGLWWGHMVVLAHLYVE